MSSRLSFGVANTLPTLRQHLEHAQGLDKGKH